MKKIEKTKNISNKLKKTLTIAIILSILVIVSASLIQFYGQSKIIEKCSYLDPWIIDIFAFLAAIFLIIEGFAKIIKNPNLSVKKQLTRIIRIMFGFSILTLHTIQVLHK